METRLGHREMGYASLHGVEALVHIALSFMSMTTHLYYQLNIWWFQSIRLLNEWLKWPTCIHSQRKSRIIFWQQLPSHKHFHFNSRFSGTKGSSHSSHSISNRFLCVVTLPAKQLTTLPVNVVDFLIGMIDRIDGNQTLAAIATLHNSLRVDVYHCWNIALWPNG